MHVVVTGNTTAGLLTDAGGEILPFTGNQIAGNPLGAAGCQLAAAASAVGCPAADVDCPDPVCPAPVCEAPIMGPGLGPCRKCRTKGPVTTCSNCTVKVE
jgi:hypothetical protein